MKKIIITAILLTSINSMAQNKNTCGKVYYTHSLKFHPIAEEEYREYMMKFNNEASYSEEINIKSSSDKTTIKDTENDFGTIGWDQVSHPPKNTFNSFSGVDFTDNLGQNKAEKLFKNSYLAVVI